MMLAVRYDRQPVGGWWMSEKFDGVRAFWDGRALRTRTWHEIFAPDWFLAALPKGVAIDGELWAGRGTFQTVSVLARFMRPGDEAWQRCRLMAFDWPTCDAIGFEERAAKLDKLTNRVLQPVTQRRIAGGAEAVAEMERVVRAGGEGVVLRKPGHFYAFERSACWLKVKPADHD